LDSYGFELFGIAKNGKKAVEMYQNTLKKPDVILMVHRMPVKTGLEASKEILAMDKNAKIIFTTADKSIKQEALSIGAYNFKEKPFTIDRLVNNIKKL